MGNKISNDLFKNEAKQEADEIKNDDIKSNNLELTSNIEMKRQKSSTATDKSPNMHTDQTPIKSMTNTKISSFSSPTKKSKCSIHDIISPIKSKHTDQLGKISFGLLSSRINYEVTESKGINFINKNEEIESKFLSAGYIIQDELCPNHFSAIDTSSFEISNRKSKSSCYFTRTLIITLQKMEEELNDFFKVVFPMMTDYKYFKINLLELNMIKEVRSEALDFSLNFVGFDTKKIYLNLEKANILIINQDQTLINSGQWLAVRIHSDGRMYAGQLDSMTLKFNGAGIFISKPGIVFSGNFNAEEQINEGKSVDIHTKMVYEGSLSNFRKNKDGKEETYKYAFYGEFYQNKKVRGYYELKYQESNDYSIRKIIVDQNTLKDKVIYEVEFDNRVVLIESMILNRSLNDENARIFLDSDKEFPRYEGSIRNNVKEGEGAFFWNKEKSIETTFKDNCFHSVDPNRPAKIQIGEEYQEVLINMNRIIKKSNS